MEAIHATYKFNISPVPSKEYWTTTKYMKTDPPFIKRPIGRPKVHDRKRDQVEDLIEGHKLKKTFMITCSKCGENGHNFKPCKGAPSNPNWKPKTRKNRRGVSTTEPATEIQISQSAPTPEARLHLILGLLSQYLPCRVATDQNPPQPSHEPTTDLPIQGINTIQVHAASNRKFRAKQPIRRKNPPKTIATQPSTPIVLSATTQPATQSCEAPKSPLAGPSKETLAAAGPGAQRIWQFMPTPDLKKGN
ncbi:hypothetical protein PIB30_067959 [Stylosanthes scabra]|uniref:CCHC-type domain-containing protein n=1 Tax=Stylosanthes scabra TaxID=79078 RepID=A0ABU6QMQ9_9FABA|nr:hypothetical protein [Stylosanthes scabra]